MPRYLWATRLWGVSRIGNNCRTNAKVYEKKTITEAKRLKSIFPYFSVLSAHVIVMMMSQTIVRLITKQLIKIVCIVTNENYFKMNSRTRRKDHITVWSTVWSTKVLHTVMWSFLLVVLFILKSRLGTTPSLVENYFVSWYFSNSTILNLLSPPPFWLRTGFTYFMIPPLRI